MKNRYSKLAWAAAVLAAVLALVWKSAPLDDAQERIKVIGAGGPQKLTNLELAPWEVEFFGDAKAARWLATGSSAAVIVTVVDGSGNRRAVHDPGYCFRGAGWTVERETPLLLPHGKAVRVDLRRDTETLEAVYWFSDGRQAYTSPTRYWWESTLRRLTLGASGPESVLVLLVPARDNHTDWGGWLATWPQFTFL